MRSVEKHADRSRNTILQDFPPSEIWRLQTDGWQHYRGPDNFREVFYKGMNQGFDFILSNLNTPLSVDLIQNIYFSAYQFEESYGKEQDMREGIRDGTLGFEIDIGLPGASEEAGISEEGLDEFIKNMIEAYHDRPSGAPRWRLKIFTVGDKPPLYISFDPNKSENLNCVYFNEQNTQQLKEYLLEQFRSAALYKANPKDSKKTEGSVTNIEISCSAKYSRADLRRYIEKEINLYQEKIKTAGSKDEKVAIIVEFIRNLHQTHPLPDGNGRTLVFLLKNLLLLQNGMSMCITQTPAHFAGFSVSQLTKETLLGLSKYAEYKITNAAQILSNLTEENILDNTEQIKLHLRETLSRDPMIAMAQLNELFIQIQDNRIVVPKNYWGESYNLGLLNNFNTGFKKSNESHAAIQTIVKQLYYENFVKLTKEVDSSSLKKFSSWIDKHQICKDIKYNYSTGKRDMRLELEEYFSSISKTSTSTI
ncbi:hypothetical protein ACQUW5_07850 [Legionella sp. CNM-1927-20]|uniref:hypothetical protein n=1 Tax=Legionella sp. CNM-1927-20 TaxID=3422221 RepID=UPI00403A9C58